MIRRPPHNPTHRNAAFTTMETLATMAVLMLVFGVLGSAILMQAKAATHLAQRRIATNHAERVLIDLQLGRPTPPAPEDYRAQIEMLADAEAPAGQRWARVTVTGAKTAGELVGLVPAANLPEDAP